MGRRVNELVRAARALVGGLERNDYAFAVREGRFAECGDFAPTFAQARDLQGRAFPENRIVIPGLVNGHSHAYQILLRGWADDRSFESWRADALYRIVPQLTPEDVYWTFVAAFSEMLAAGITSVAEFFYLNGEGNARAEAAICASRDTGIRLVFARTWMDADYAPQAFVESAQTAADRTAELMERYPDANVCVAPHSLHAASPEMIRAAAQFARDRNCAMHAHVAEAAYESEQTLARFGTTPIELLDQLDALDERTVAIHAIYITEREKELLAARGARVIHNPMTNQYLGDGTCDVLGLQALGVTMGLGTDADVKPSIFDEMRAASLLQKLAHRDGSVLDAKTAFALGTSQGGAALGLPIGDLTSGGLADFVVLDASGIDPWSPPISALIHRAESRWVQATYVNGRRVYNGEPSPLAHEAFAQLKAIARRLI
jgi:5-methylthioadenosine/S-adenosylhomocysteine deaminase